MTIVHAFPSVGIAISMLPVLKRTIESPAIGYVCIRLLESTIIILGIFAAYQPLTWCPFF